MKVPLPRTLWMLGALGASTACISTSGRAETPPAHSNAVVATDAASSASVDAGKVVGGAPMTPTRDIIDNAVNSKDHTTLVTAVKAADLVATLKGDGPFTMFAPTNEAFAKLPAGTIDSLLKPENKDRLKKVLTYHVLAERLSAIDLMKKIEEGKGKAKLTTIEGETLVAKLDGKSVVIEDSTGHRSHVTIADVDQKNGVMHVIDGVVLPG